MTQCKSCDTTSIAHCKKTQAADLKTDTTSFHFLDLALAWVHQGLIVQAYLIRRAQVAHAASRHPDK